MTPAFGLLFYGYCVLSTTAASSLIVVLTEHFTIF